MDFVLADESVMIGGTNLAEKKEFYLARTLTCQEALGAKAKTLRSNRSVAPETEGGDAFSSTWSNSNAGKNISYDEKCQVGNKIYQAEKTSDGALKVESSRGNIVVTYEDVTPGLNENWTAAVSKALVRTAGK